MVAADNTRGPRQLCQTQSQPASFSLTTHRVVYNQVSPSRHNGLQIPFDCRHLAATWRLLEPQNLEERCPSGVVGAFPRPPVRRVRSPMTHPATGFSLFFLFSVFLFTLGPLFLGAGDTSIGLFFLALHDVGQRVESGAAYVEAGDSDSGSLFFCIHSPARQICILMFSMPPRPVDHFAVFTSEYCLCRYNLLVASLFLSFWLRQNPPLPPPCPGRESRVTGGKCICACALVWTSS